MIGSGNFNFMHVANKLIQESLLVVNKGKKQKELMVTQLGRASTLSFFSPQKTISVKKLLLKNKHFLSISLEMNRLQNIYLSKKLHTYLEKTYHMKFSTRLEGPVLDVMNASLKGTQAMTLTKRRPTHARRSHASFVWMPKPEVCTSSCQRFRSCRSS